MKDVIQRNIERLLYPDCEGEQERIEPMTEWKWNRLCNIVSEYDIGPWIAEGIKAYESDFFLNMPEELKLHLLALSGEKDENKLERFLLQMERNRGMIHRLSVPSLKAYANDLINNIKTIEE